MSEGRTADIVVEYARRFMRDPHADVDIVVFAPAAALPGLRARTTTELRVLFAARQLTTPTPDVLIFAVHSTHHLVMTSHRVTVTFISDADAMLRGLSADLAVVHGVLDPLFSTRVIAPLAAHTRILYTATPMLTV